jgi:hypothetical protein
MLAPMNETASEFRGPDRRRRPTPMLSRWLLSGRRRGGRREGERRHVYVDRPGFWALAGFFLILTLSILDAAFTLALLRRGATEANPVMQATLHLGDGAFVFIKTVVTAAAAGFLCLHKNWPLGRFCTVAAIVGYGVLTAFHLHAQATL